MGYSYYLYTIEKSKLEEIKDSCTDYSKLISTFGEEDHFYPPYLPMTRTYDIGDMDAIYLERIHGKGKPVFSEEISNQLEDIIFDVGQSGLEELISIYKEKVLEYFMKISKDYKDPHFPSNNKTASEMQALHVKQKIYTWKRFPPVDVNKNSEKVVDSTEYEYVVFELARILKTINFDTHTLILTGH